MKKSWMLIAMFAVCFFASAAIAAESTKNASYGWLENTVGRFQCAKITPQGGFIRWEDASLCPTPVADWVPRVNGYASCAHVTPDGRHGYIDDAPASDCPAGLHVWQQQQNGYWNCAHLSSHHDFISWADQSSCPAPIYDWVMTTSSVYRCAAVTPGTHGLIRWVEESHCD